MVYSGRVLDENVDAHLALAQPRDLSELDGDTGGQLVIEWVLVTTVVVVPLLLLVPMMLNMIRAYFYRISNVVSLPFP